MDGLGQKAKLMGHEIDYQKVLTDEMNKNIQTNTKAIETENDRVERTL